MNSARGRSRLRIRISPAIHVKQIPGVRWRHRTAIIAMPNPASGRATGGTIGIHPGVVLEKNNASTGSAASPAILATVAPR